MTNNKWLPLLLILLALALLIPGLSLPMLSLDAQADKSHFTRATIDMMTDDGDVRGFLGSLSNLMGFNQQQGQVEVFHQSRSILGTIAELLTEGNLLLGLLVGLFAVVIPTAKLLCQAALLFVSGAGANILQRLISAIGKWSMADVFMVAIILSFLAGNAQGQTGKLIHFNATLEPGFWCFTGYCLVAIASNLLMQHKFKGLKL